MKSLPPASENVARPQQITVLDIAADAGVSRATVSLVLREVPVVAEVAERKRYYYRDSYS